MSVEEDEIEKMFADNYSSESFLTAAGVQVKMKQHQQDAIQKAQSMMAQGTLGSQYQNGSYGGVTGSAAPMSPRFTLMEKLQMRLNINRHDAMPFKFIHAVENPEGGNVLIFIIQGGKPVTLEDDPNLFPSDRLVSQLNLIRS